MTMKYIFILNPLAGSGANEMKIRKAIDALPEADDCELYVTHGERDATAFVRKWCDKHPGEAVRFIACGGDGTINEVFNGAVGYENVSVTCYPCGSGNDFVKTFGGAERFLDIPSLVHAPLQKLDILKVGDRYCVNVLNFGFDTTVARTVQEDRNKNGHGSKNSYTKGILIALMKSMRNKFSVKADGEEMVTEGEALFCTLGNGQYVGGSFKCAPRAVPNDGWIEVCVVKCISRLRVPGIIGIYTRGEHLDSPKMKDIVRYKRAKHIEVEAPEGFAYSLDGEIIYENHFMVDMVEGALDLAVPE